MRSLRQTPEGNPDRTAELEGLPGAAVALETDYLRTDAGRNSCKPGCTLCRRYALPVPHGVAMTILDDMAMFHVRSKRWSCHRFHEYGLACPHGYTFGCPA